MRRISKSSVQSWSQLNVNWPEFVKWVSIYTQDAMTNTDPNITELSALNSFIQYAFSLKKLPKMSYSFKNQGVKISLFIK